jgi:hypothetical protein
MLEFNRERILANVRAATTDDLLDRATVYRDGMEPEALELIEAELCRRGVGADQVDAHAAGHGDGVLRSPDGVPVRCGVCDRPAVARGWRWQRLRGNGLVHVVLNLLPLYRPHFGAYCAAHGPRSRPARASSAGGPVSG